MNMRRVLPAVVLVMALASPAHAAQLDPRTAPVTSGPLVDDSDSYDGNRCTRNRVPGLNGEVAAVAKFCWTFYRLEPGAETDSARDYGVWWIQSIVKPKNGWCASKIVTQLSMDTEAELHAISGKDFRTGRATRITPKLSVDAEGTATSPASVKQSLKLFPKKMVTKIPADSKTLKMVWTGASRRPIAAAGGVEGSWATGSGPSVFLPGMSPRMVSDC